MKLEVNPCMVYKYLKQRTFDFAVGKLISWLPNNPVNRAYFAQIVRSSSSVGSNYRASQRAKSARDFLNKLKIVEEETDETIYFLELLKALNDHYSESIAPLITEGTEILKIIVASINTTRRKLNTDNNPN